MKPPRDKSLSVEDRILWGRVARSTTPLRDKSIERPEAEPERFETLLDTQDTRLSGKKTSPRHTEPPAQPDNPASRGTRPSGIDVPTRAKLAKGRLPIEGKVDLHGLTQGEAHALLLSFLHRAYADGRRHVLVVTGKGSSVGSDGILRRAVPAWLATPPFRVLVGAYEGAARHHGGEGAIYVRLRRRDGVS